MFRILFMSACFSACLAGSIFGAQGAMIGGDGSKINQTGDVNQGGSIFDDLNKKFNENPIKANGRDPELVKQLIQKLRNEPKGLVTKTQSAVCPICREMMYRHSEDGFRCIPKDSGGDEMPMQEIKWKRVACPVCQAKFLGAMPGNLNTKNGVDRDTCIHSVGRACVQSNVWTCPDCGYAAMIDSFGLAWDGKPIGDDTKNFVLQTIKPVMFKRMCKLIGITDESAKKGDLRNLGHFAEYVQQEDLQQDMINDWYKYDNAITIYKFQKAPSTLMARLYLDGVHACRRELNGEIAVPLQHAATDEELSIALRRVQHDVTAASLRIRQDRNALARERSAMTSRNQTVLLDPNRADIDPQVLCEAAEMIIAMGDRGDGKRIEQDRNQPADAKQFYTQCDMFVLSLRYAGFLDRVGRMEDADAALLKAAKYIPDDVTLDNTNVRELNDYSNKQLKVLREFIDSRRKCLAFEKECINRAMWENLLAIHHHKVVFIDPLKPLVVPEKDARNPAEKAYMIGELARRCKEPSAAAAFFAAAEAIIKLQFSELDKEELKIEALKNTRSNDYAEGKARAKLLNTSWGMLQNWVADQSKLPLVGGPLDEQIKIVLDEVLQSSGIDPKSFKIPDVKSTVSASEAAAIARINADKPAVSGTAETALSAAPAKPSGKMTRDALLKLYFDAISKYVKEKKANPAALTDLVSGNYVSQDNSCLDDKGVLYCPETNAKLKYARNFQLGSRDDFVIFQIKDAATSKVLYANGEIRLPFAKK